MRALAARPSRRPYRRLAGVAAVLAGAGLLAGCGGGGTAPAAAPRQVASPAAATGTVAPSADLARGLLPADAFGAGTTVVPFSLPQLQQRLAAVPGGLASALHGVTVSPEGCAEALQTLGAGLAGVTGVAGEGARTGAGGTAEALLTGAPVAGAVDSLTTLSGACSHAEVTSPHGTATVDLAPVTVPDLGDGAAAVRATAVLTPAAGTGHGPVTVSGLLSVVRDGDRLLLLGTAAPGSTAPDVGMFTSLLQRAYDTAHALG